MKAQQLEEQKQGSPGKYYEQEQPQTSSLVDDFQVVNDDIALQPQEILDMYQEFRLNWIKNQQQINNKQITEFQKNKKKKKNI